MVGVFLITYLYLFIFKLNVFCSYVLWLRYYYYYFCGCCNKSRKHGVLKQQKFFSQFCSQKSEVSVNESKSRCCRDERTSSGGFGEKPVPCLSSFLWMPAFFGCGCITAISVSWSNCPLISDTIQENIEERIAFCLFLIRIVVIAFRALRGNAGQLYHPQILCHEK